MSNATPDSPLLQGLKLPIGLLSPRERPRLGTCLLAKFDVKGCPSGASTTEPRPRQHHA